MMQPREIASAWRDLRARMGGDDTENEVATLETGAINSVGAVRLVARTETTRGLLIPIARETRIEEPHRTSSIVVRRALYSCGGKKSDFIEVECISDNLAEVFSELVSDILRRIENGKAGQIAVDESIDEFRTLIASRSGSQKDKSAVIGLIGELLLLHELLQLNANAWQAWFGPEKDRHDFRAGTLAIEVKTSGGSGRQRVQINGIEQLKEPANGKLLLQHWSLEPSPTGQHHISALVADCLRAASDSEAFRRRLADIGYDHDDPDAWDFQSFDLVAGDAYTVDSQFPRIIDRSIGGWPISGVDGLTYTVDLSVAQGNQLRDSAREEFLEDFVSCL